MTRATSVPILVFLGLSVLDLGQMYATDVRQHYRLMTLPRGGGITTINFVGLRILHHARLKMDWLCRERLASIMLSTFGRFLLKQEG